MSPDLQPQPACPACTSQARRTIGKRGDLPIPALLRGAAATTVVDVVRCSNCGHYYCDPLPTPESLAALYEHVHDYFGPGAGGQASATLEAIVAATGVTPGRLLDVGCGEGRLLDAARERGWDAIGIEPTAAFAARARAGGHHVHSGDLADLAAAEPFDLVCFSAVLEHVPDPVELMACAVALLRPGGWLYADVPNGRRLDAWLVDRTLRLVGRPWTVRTAPLQPPFHLSEFSATSLETAAARAGLERITVRRLPGSIPYPFPQPLAAGLRLVHRLGALFGGQVNLAVAAAKPRAA